MILVRNTFQLKFGVAKEAKARIKEGIALANAAGIKLNRACMDVTGPFYTLVFENSYENLADYEATLPKVMQDAKWQAWYTSFAQLVESGHREIYTIIE